MDPHNAPVAVRATDGAVIEVPLPPGGVEVVLRDPVTGAQAGRWRFPEGGSRLHIDLLSEGLCEVDGRAAAEAELEPGFIPWPRLSFLVNGEPLEVVSSNREVLRRHYAREHHQEVSYAPSPNGYIEAFHRARIQQAQRLLRPVRGKVLDVGSGYSLVAMAGPWPELDIYACDWDGDAVRHLHQGGAVHHAVRCSASDLCFAPRSFDAVYAGEVIEHLIDRPGALRQWIELIRPGGRLVLTTPNRRHLLVRCTRVEQVQNPEHLHEYTVAELRGEIEAAGGRVLATEGLTLPLPVYVPGRGWRDGMQVLSRYVPNHVTALRRLVGAGRPLPRLAMNLAMVITPRG